MRVCVMVEGQEGVLWEHWRALARATEDAGLEGLVQLRPLRSNRPQGKDRRTRRLGDAVRARGNHLDDPARRARLTCHVPISLHAREAGYHR